MFVVILLDDTVPAVILDSWLVGKDTCLWPDVDNCTLELMLANGEVPRHNVCLRSCKIKHRTNSLKEARCVQFKYKPVRNGVASLLQTNGFAPQHFDSGSVSRNPNQRNPIVNGGSVSVYPNYTSNGMMLRSLYPYDGPFEGSLRFTVNESFLKIRNENEYWFLVSKPDGTVGCVPYNYVEPDKNQDDQIIAKWAKLALASVNHSSSLKNKDGILEVLRKLSKEQNDVLPDPLPQPALKHSVTPPVNRPKQETGNHTRVNHSRPSENGTGPTPTKAVLPGGLATRLVDTLRLGTNAGYSDCYNSFRAILEILASEVPDLRPHTTLLETMLTNSTTDQRHSSYKQCPDWYLLNRYFTHLERRLNNNQECGWELHENQLQLSRDLDSLNDILTKANTELLQLHLKSTDYRHMECLIELYHREHRITIRRKLLLAIGICCSLDPTCLSVCVSSVLPHELIRELETANSESDLHHLAMCLRVFTVLLTRTTELSVDVRNKLNSQFLSQILKFTGPTEKSDITTSYALISLDSPSKDSVRTMMDPLFEGQLAHAATALLLACNWHFCSIAAKKNREKIPLLAALLSQPNACRSFLELVVQAFNRDVDPITFVDFKPSTQSPRTKRLVRWSDLLTNSASVCTDYGLELAESTSLASLFEGETDSTEVSLDADDGQYARRIWSDGPASREQPSVILSTPNTLSPTTPRNSVLKLLMDLFHSMDTADIVYRNDQDVIIEVISRQLSNLTLDDSERILDFSVLLGLIIANSDYLKRGAYRGHELIQSLETLLKSEPMETITSVTYKRRFECARISHARLRSALQPQ